MTKLLALAASLAAAAAVVACGSPCQDLASRICGCQPAGVLRDNCNSSVKNELGAASPTSEQEATCQSLLSTCKDPSDDKNACDRLNTPQGKIDCGLAAPSAPDAGTPDAGP